MAIRNIMVHLDLGPRTEKRLGLAVSLARKHGARLVGVFGQLADAQRVGVVAAWPPEEYREAAEASRKLFDAGVAGLPRVDWVDANRGSESEVIRVVTMYARHADLVVMGQHDERGRPAEPADLVHDVIMQSGRPVLVVPYIGDFDVVGRSPLIAWSDTREAARALMDSLEVIAGCRDAHVVSMGAKREEAEEACAQAAAHLALHGIDAKVEAFVLVDNEGVGVMDMLLNRVTDRTADLLVMGAHGGGSNLPFASKGSGTRHILRHMTVPVLMSN